jgi:hypothetical protein
MNTTTNVIESIVNENLSQFIEKITCANATIQTEEISYPLKINMGDDIYLHTDLDCWTEFNGYNLLNYEVDLKRAMALMFDETTRNIRTMSKLEQVIYLQDERKKINDLRTIIRKDKHGYVEHCNLTIENLSSDEKHRHTIFPEHNIQAFITVAYECIIYVEDWLNSILNAVSTEQPIKISDIPPIKTPPKKYRLDISRDDLNALIFLLRETGIWNGKDPGGFAQHIADYFSTVEADDISVKQIRKKMYTPEGNSLDRIKKTLEQLISSIDNYYK